MITLQVKNFGPIKNGFHEDGNEHLPIKKVTLFIGSQGSGKSTVAKLFSTLTWIEKSLVRGTIDVKDLKNYKRFQKKYCAYQNIHNYFKKDSYIHYKGAAYELIYANEGLTVHKNQDTGSYLMPKIMYVPAERNFVTAVTQPEKLKYLPQTLFTFLDEYQRSLEEIENSVTLPVNRLTVRHDRKKGITELIGQDYEVQLTEASSGLQSLVPLYIVSKNLAEGINTTTDYTKSKNNLEDIQLIRKRIQDLIDNKKFLEETKITLLTILSSYVKNDCFINVVEEPEQNLYPTSQKEILSSLLSFNNLNKGNKLIMTTHSPYLLNYLTLIIKAGEVYQNLLHLNSAYAEDIKTDIQTITPTTAFIHQNDFAVYQLSDEGDIKLLDTYNGLPSDENYLNQNLADLNYLFTDLLEIEEKWQQIFSSKVV